MAGTITSLNFKLSSPNSQSFSFPKSINFKTLIPNRQFRTTSISIKNPSITHLPPKLTRFTVNATSSSDSIDDGGIADSEARNSVFLSKFARAVLDFTANNFLPLALIGGVALGLANPSLGCLADQYSLSKVSTFCIFIISGLTLRSQEIGAATDAWPVGLFGLASILLLTPVFSSLILQLSFQPPEFGTGLAIFTCMPTSLSSGVSLTQLAKGNFALALAMTVISNLLGILVVPFTVSKFVAAGVGISIPTEQLLKSLVVTLLIPLILGKVLREAIAGDCLTSLFLVDASFLYCESIYLSTHLSTHPPICLSTYLPTFLSICLSASNTSDVSFTGVGNFADNNRKLLSILNAVFLSLVPWIQVSKSRSLLLMVNPTSFLLAIGLGALLHIVLLAFNALAIKTLSFLSGGKRSVFSNPQNAIALLLVGSQKTLPVTVAVVDQLGGAMGASGLLVLPCVAAHLNQIILDSFLVNYLLRRDQSADHPKTV